MADRYWEQRTARRHAYVDETGRVIGSIHELFMEREYVATAYDTRLGSYVHYADARLAVENACRDIETAKAATQADGAQE